MMPIAIYVVIRWPFLIHTSGGQDEHWFSVPGYLVWQEGIPRVPYLPTRNRESLFENADRCLMALPPALFYVQAPFHALFEPGYPTSRLPSFLGAIASIALLFFVSRRLGVSYFVAAMISTLFALSRPLMFTGQISRPDLLCSLCGWLCLLQLWKHLGCGGWKWLIGSGSVCGLGALFHPFALVFAIQAGIALLAGREKLHFKVARLVVFGISTMLIVSLWIPLIIRFPHEFRSQFFANVLDRAGPGLLSRIFWPWASLRHHWTLVSEFAGPWQLASYGFAAAIGFYVAWRTRSRSSAIRYAGVCLSSIFLTAVVAGVHPSKGYWVYACFWMLLGLAIALQHAFSLPAVSFKTRMMRVGSVVFLVSLMLPGAGLKSTYIYLKHWGDPTYHAKSFIRNVLNEIPNEGVFYCDMSFVYDVYLSGRETRMCQEKKQYWGDGELPFTALLLSQEGEDANWAEQYGASIQKRFGQRVPEQACFVDLYTPIVKEIVPAGH
jgi:hypothetical protein